MPLERALNSVPNVINRRSKTIFGLSVIQLTFADGTDDYFARSRVLEKIGDAVLPDGVQPSLGPLTSPVGEILRYVIQGDGNQTPMQLRTYQDWIIIPRLLQVNGVADVINFGGLVKQFHIITAPDKLFGYNLSIQNVIDAVTSNNINTGGNIIRRGGQGFIVREIGALRNKNDIENIVITTQNGVPIYIKNIGTVEESPLPPTGILGITMQKSGESAIDAPSAIQGIVAMRRGENPSDVIASVKEKIDEINKDDLPSGVKLVITYDRSELVDYTLHTVAHTLFMGISIVIIVLIFFMGSVRSALVVVTTIPISLLFAFSMMKLTGIPANLLSLGAIDFGIIVDGAVVMVENIMRRYRNATPEQTKPGIIRFTLSSAQEVGQEIFFSITIIILAYLPIFTFQRVEGKLFSPMAFTLAFAITGSLILALTGVPILMSYLYKKYFAENNLAKIEWHNPVYEWIQNKYSRAIFFLTDFPKYTSFVSIAFSILLILVLGRFIGTEFLPELDEGAINIRCFFPVGISIQEADKYSPIIRETISKHKQTSLVVAQLGRNDDGTDPYGPNRLEILVGLKNYALWTSDTTKTELLTKIKKELEANVPGATFSFSQPILDNVTEAVTGSVADLAIFVNGNDLKYSRAIADSVLEVIKGMRGATEYGIEQEGDQAQLKIEINRNAAARFGINVSDIQKMIEAAIGGKPVSKLYDGIGRFDIVVRYSPEYRSSIQSIQHMLVTSPSGGRIPMSELASISLVDGPTIIQREDGKRQISIRTNINGRDQGGFVAEAQAKVAQTVKLPKGYSLEWGGQFENLNRAGKRLSFVIPITLLIIFSILFMFYKNFRQVIVAMSCIPFALVGGISAILIRGYHFNVSAGVGFISLFGISILSGVLFVSRTNKLIRDSGLDLKSAVREAAVIQLRPSLMTMLLALFGLIPAALAAGIGSDVQRPLATVIVGGLLSALILTLLALPSVYLTIINEQKDSKKLDSNSEAENG